MSEILSNIVVEQNSINFSPETNNINITPEAIQLNIFTGASPGAGYSNNGELLYNNTNLIDGVPFTSYANGILTLGDPSNISITGGNNGYFLQTDGAGNLAWAAGGGGGGNGSPGGSNTQIQYNDNGTFGGAVGFTFNEVSGNVAIPGSLAVASLISGTLSTAAQPNITSVGNLNGVTVTGSGILATNIRTTSGQVGLGLDAGLTGQGNYAVGVGSGAGYFNQGSNAVAIGFQAGYDTQGSNSIAIGTFAGNSFQPANTIILNATGAALNIPTNQSNRFYVKPMRSATNNNFVFYDDTTGEITYGTSSTANYAAYAGNVTIAAQPNITSLGTLTGLSVNGTVTAVNITANSGIITGNGSGLTALNASNLSTGTVSNARLSGNYTININGSATTAGTVTTNAQPNITSLGTLTALTVNGTANLISVNNLKLPGGSSNQFIRTDGNGNLSFASIPSSVAGSNTQIQYNDNGNLAGNSNLTFNQSTATLTTTNIAVANITTTGVSNLNSVSNVKITGGASGYFLQTDGSGNLVWAAGTGNVTGNASAAGANTSIQLSDGTGNFAAVSGFTYDSSTSLLSVPGGANISGNILTTGTMTVQQIKEKVTSNSTGSTGTVNFDILDSAILLKTTQATANFIINIRGNATTTLDSVMSSNQSMTCTYLNTNGVTPRYATAIQIDGANRTVRWVGGAPTSGNVGIDSYTFNIIKTAANTYTILGARLGHS